MPDTFTANYTFTKPEEGASDGTWDTKLNADLDSIDTQIKNRQNEAATATANAATAQARADTAHTRIDTLVVVQNPGDHTINVYSEISVAIAPGAGVKQSYNMIASVPVTATLNGLGIAAGRAIEIDIMVELNGTTKSWTIAKGAGISRLLWDYAANLPLTATGFHHIKVFIYNIPGGETIAIAKRHKYSAGVSL